eukprot:TRINITY_DN9112_c0_g2_i2.p1 TRINITY_DN9112_c0_g2~~TRINITY_DN9112_c0_g2_i2.p1  ORF type:complete len:124 (-),score=8.40 TRINITY_DN9112_c0_g2_i2:143-514(-)
MMGKASKAMVTNGLLRTTLGEEEGKQGATTVAAGTLIAAKNHLLSSGKSQHLTALMHRKQQELGGATKLQPGHMDVDEDATHVQPEQEHALVAALPQQSTALHCKQTQAHEDNSSLSHHTKGN